MRTHVGESCAHCGGKMVEYLHTLTVALIESLARLAVAGGKAPLSELSLSRSQWTNFQKLRYWGLVGKAYDKEGLRDRNAWEITRRGWRFLNGTERVPKLVWTFRGEFVRWEGALMAIDDVIEGYWSRSDYAALRKAHSPEAEQLSFL